MNYDDDRTSDEKRTHTALLGGRDRAMSGWGLAGGGASWAFWACRPEDTDAVLAWVRQRRDLRDRYPAALARPYESGLHSLCCPRGDARRALGFLARCVQREPGAVRDPPGRLRALLGRAPRARNRRPQGRIAAPEGAWRRQ